MKPGPVEGKPKLSRRRDEVGGRNAAQQTAWFLRQADKPGAGFVVCGFALYGLVAFVEGQKAGAAIMKVNSSQASEATAPTADTVQAHSNETASRRDDPEPAVA